MVRELAFVAALAVVPAGASAQQPCTTDARHVVNELYRHILERSADRGSDRFVQRLNRGESVRELVREMAKSPEHVRRFSPTGNEGRDTVSILFRHILNRPADSGGLQAHTTGLHEQGYAAVVDALVESDEYTANYGDFGVPGSPGLRFCGRGDQTSSTLGGWRARERAVGTSGVSQGLSDATFDNLDRNRNGRLERNEWNGSASQFDDLDRNGNNLLTRAEAVDNVSGGSRNELTRQFNGLDASGDGRLTIQEWNWNRRTFEQQDANDDGYITPREFTGAPSGTFNFR